MAADVWGSSRGPQALRRLQEGMRAGVRERPEEDRGKTEQKRDTGDALTKKSESTSPKNRLDDNYAHLDLLLLIYKKMATTIAITIKKIGQPHFSINSLHGSTLTLNDTSELVDSSKN